MAHLSFQALLFGLAFIGLAGFSTSPYRAYEAARFAYRRGPKPAALLALLAASALLYAWGVTYQRVIFGCLTQMVCGPNRSHGVILLAEFGTIVAGYELLRLIAVRLYHRRHA